MSLEAYLRLFLAVLGDWRVIAAVLGTLFAWAALRYVGLIYHKAPLAKRRKKATAPSPKRGGKAPPAAEESPELGEE